MRKLWVPLGASLLVLAQPGSAETMTNDSVVSLVVAGLGDEAVIAKIKASANSFRLDSADLVQLKTRGVSSPVLAAMLSSSGGGAVSSKAMLSATSGDPNVPHPPGVYLLVDDAAAARMERLDPTTTNQTKTGGIIGYALTSGIASMSVKSVVPNPTARVRTTRSQPTFYFYFDEALASLSLGASPNFFGIGAGATVTSPSEFSLVRLTPKKDRREVKTGSLNITGAKSGVMDKDRVAISYDLVSPGVYRVKPSQPLAPGEYAFLYSVSAGTGSGFGGSGGVNRIFDFAVSGPAVNGAKAVK